MPAVEPTTAIICTSLVLFTRALLSGGSKTTSGSYIMWPAHIGAFTMIMGRHYKNYNTSALPFSYLIEEDKEGLLFPAVNLKSVGTYRDELKWQQRDKRKGIDIIDQGKLPGLKSLGQLEE